MYYTTERTTKKLVQDTYRNTVFIVVVSFLHCLSSSCAAWPTSLAETYVREEIEELRQELGLGSYPAGAGLTIKEVEFPASTTMKITVYWEVLYSTEYLTIGWLESLHLDWVFFLHKKIWEGSFECLGSTSIPGMWTMRTWQHSNVLTDCYIVYLL